MTKQVGKITVTCIFIALMALTVFDIGVKAQTSSAIVINPDGSVSGTSLIQRDGDTYRLTADLNDQPITVLCNGVLLNGEGFTLQGLGGWGIPGKAGVEVSAALNLKCSNVTVENFCINGYDTGIVGTFNGNTVENNSITQTESAIAIYADNYLVQSNYVSGCIDAITIRGDNNQIQHNQLVDNYCGALLYPSLNTTVTANTFTASQVDLTIGTYENYSYLIYDNNFLNNATTVTLQTTSDALGLGSGGSMPPWDNGTVGNYWSDYTAKYPGAAEAGNTGVGDTPYQIQENSVVDRYPLMTPVNITATPATQTLTSDTSVSKQVQPTTTQMPKDEGTADVLLIATLAISAALCVSVVFRSKLSWKKKSN